MPIALRRVLGQDAIEPEHRLATVAFVKFEGVDEIMSSTGPEAVAAALHEFVTAVQVAADRAGVTLLATDVDKNGGKAILVAGVPFTQDDDDGRVLTAVREILDAKTWLRTRAGVNRGHVFAGEVGSMYRATYTIIGDTVNLAARLMAAAPTGALYVAPEVVERSRTLFATEALEPFTVKGKSQPVRAVAVGAAIGMRSQRRAHELQFVGREAELEVVEQAIAAAAGGAGSVLTIVGEAGAGKSRLIDEALSLAQPPTVIRVQSEQSGSTAAYRGLRDPIRALLGIERGEQGAMAAQLRDAVADRAHHLLPMLPLLGDVVHVDVASTRRSTASMFDSDRLARATLWWTCSTPSPTVPSSWFSTTRNGWTAPLSSSSSALRAPYGRVPGCSSPHVVWVRADRTCERHTGSSSGRCRRVTRGNWSSPRPRRCPCARTSST